MSITKSIPWNEQLYNIPIYSVADAARYVKIPIVTLKTWVNGRFYSTKNGKKSFLPIIQRPNPENSKLSFTNLVEAHVLRSIRTNHKISLDKVRAALDYLTQKFQTPHPLVQKQFKTDGVDLFIDQLEHLVNVSRSGQLTIKEALENLLSRVEWDEKEIASTLYPFIANYAKLSNKDISIDPRFSFGKPIITRTGVPTMIIVQRYNAGDSIEELANDYDCTVLQVKNAIEFEESRLFAA